MWLFTVYGFFSIAAEGQSKVSVRARKRLHLELLKKRFAGWDAVVDRARIVATPTRDYPFRMTLPKNTWARMTAVMSQEIDSAKFKPSIRRVSPGIDTAYASVVYKVWQDLLDALGGGCYDTTGCGIGEFGWSGWKDGPVKLKAGENRFRIMPSK